MTRLAAKVGLRKNAAPGSIFTDGFSRTGAVAGSSTETGGGVWAGYGYSANGSVAVPTDTSNADLPLPSGQGSITATVVGGTGTSGNSGIALRLASDGNTWYASYTLVYNANTSLWQFSKNGNPVVVTSGIRFATLSSGTEPIMKLERVGTTLQWYINGVLQGTYADPSPIAVTIAGIVSSIANVGNIDNVIVA